MVGQFTAQTAATEAGARRTATSRPLMNDPGSTATATTTTTTTDHSGNSLNGQQDKKQ